MCFFTVSFARRGHFFIFKSVKMSCYVITKTLSSALSTSFTSFLRVDYSWVGTSCISKGYTYLFATFPQVFPAKPRKSGTSFFCSCKFLLLHLVSMEIMKGVRNEKEGKKEKRKKKRSGEKRRKRKQEKKSS